MEWERGLAADRLARVHGAGLRRRRTGSWFRLCRDHDRRLPELRLLERRQYPTAQEQPVTRLPRTLSSALALGALVFIPGGRATSQTVTGNAVAAIVKTPALGSQKFADATLPAGGGMDQAESDAAQVANTLGATGLNSMAIGQVDTG